MHGEADRTLPDRGQEDIGAVGGVGVQDELPRLPSTGLGKSRHERGELAVWHGDDDELAAAHDLDSVENRHTGEHRLDPLVV